LYALRIVLHTTLHTTIAFCRVLHTTLHTTLAFCHVLHTKIAFCRVLHITIAFYSAKTKCEHQGGNMNIIVLEKCTKLDEFDPNEPSQKGIF